MDALLEEGIVPCVTIFHWDYPLHLKEAYGAFDSEQDIVRDFVSYADLLFQRLGDRVKHWITINEVSYWLSIMAAIVDLKSRISLLSSANTGSRTKFRIGKVLPAGM